VGITCSKNVKKLSRIQVKSRRALSIGAAKKKWYKKHRKKGTKKNCKKSLPGGGGCVLAGRLARVVLRHADACGVNKGSQ